MSANSILTALLVVERRRCINTKTKLPSVYLSHPSIENPVMDKALDFLYLYTVWISIVIGHRKSVVLSKYFDKKN